MAFKQMINIPMVLAVGFVSVVVLVILILGTQAWYQSAEQAETQLKASASPANEFVQLKRAQINTLETVGWSDASKTSVTIPIEQAMDKVIQTGGSIPTTEPATQPTTAP